VTKPKPPSKATPGGDAKRNRVPVFPWPRTEVAEAAAGEFAQQLQAAIDSGKPGAIEAAIRAQREHPDSVAKALIEEALQSVHLDPRVHRDAPWLGHFVMLMRELLHDHVPGMTLMEMLGPLHRALSQNSGGRPRKATRELVMPTLTALEKAWHSSPVKETASKLGYSTRQVGKIKKNEKPG